MIQTEVTKLPERNLDVLRALAVLLVVLDHVMQEFRSTQHVFGMDYREFGRLGVLLFFVHTSLVLMASLERGGRGDGWVTRFYVRRVCRIYPLAIAAVIAALVIHIPAGRILGIIPATPKVVISNLLLIQNLTNAPSVTGNLWTLPIELQMYLFLPALYLLARRSVLLVLGALAFSVACFAVIAYAPIPGIWRLTFLQFGPCFVGGGVLSFAILRHRRPLTLPSWTWPLVLFAAIGFYELFNPTVEHPQTGWPVAIFLGVVIPFVREIPESVYHRATKTIAKYSYGIYLTHGMALWAAFDLIGGLSEPARWAIFALLFVMLPWIAYTFIEAPGIALGQRLVHGPITRASTAPAP
jgi:peptidoglycan/LPS O-acetylase OafA/YrhL